MRSGSMRVANCLESHCRAIFLDSFQSSEKDFDRAPIFALIKGPISPDHWTRHAQMGKHSGWSQGRRRTRQQLEDAAVEAWIRTTGCSQFFKLSRDFTHAKARKRMVWQQRVRSLTPAEFKRTYRMTLKTFYAVLRNIRPAFMSSVKARRDLGGAVAAELKLSMTLRYLAGGSYLDIYQMHGVSRTTFFETIPVVCRTITGAYPLHFPINDPEGLVSTADS